MLVARSTLFIVLGSISAVVALAAACSPDDTLPADDTTSTTGGGVTSTTSAGPTSAASTTSPGVSTGATAATTSGGGCQGLGDACTDCTFTQCQQLYCACGESAACNMLASCTAACAPNNAQCLQTCYTQNQAGIADGIILSECAATSCAAQCPTIARPEACQLCAAQNCEQQLNACVANPECTQLIACVTDCNGDQFCQLGCSNDFGGGQDQAEALANCAQPVCPACQ